MGPKFVQLLEIPEILFIPQMPKGRLMAITEPLFKLLHIVEKLAAYGQGKGYGSSTIKHEVDSVIATLGYRPKLAIDIGGNIGEYTAQLCQSFPDLEIHTFEPSSTNLSILNKRFSKAPNITILPYGVSNCSETATLYSDKAGSGLGSLTKRRFDHFNKTFDHTESIETIRFEDYWRNQLKCRELDLVKIDIEGHELQALEGFGSAINGSFYCFSMKSPTSRGLAWMVGAGC